MSRLSDFISLSRTLGANPLLVQGGGGNASVKLSDSELAVKASGCFLREVSAFGGYVVFDLPKLVAFFSQKDVPKEGYPQSAFIGGPARTPSMELAFHSLIPEIFVAHTHPVFLNYFLCRTDAQKALQEAFPSVRFQFVEYATPGNALALKIRDGLLSIGKGQVRIIFLQNHGLIVAGNEASEVAKATNELCDAAQKRAYSAGAPKFEGSKLFAEKGGFVNRNSYVQSWFLKSKGSLPALFPDAAVFCEKVPSVFSFLECPRDSFAFVKGCGIFYNCGERKARAIDEILDANIYLLCSIPQKEQKALSTREIAFLIGMDSEKFRKSAV